MLINLRNTDNKILINTDNGIGNYLIRPVSNEYLKTQVFKNTENPGSPSPRPLKLRKISHEKPLPIKRKLFANNSKENELPISWLLNNRASKEIQKNITLGLDTQKKAFKEKEPSLWISFEINENQKIKLKIPPCYASIKNLIYIFRNKKTGGLLIGKTGTTFSKRMSLYLNAFNAKDQKTIPKKITEKNFVEAVKANPTEFEVGILHALQSREDLNQMESLFIEYKGEDCFLYNQRKGGAGGLARSEEKPVTYAIPKEGNFTPPKYYPLREDSKGRIRPEFSPGYNKYFKRLESSRSDNSQGYLYSVKDLTNEKKYRGATSQDEAPNRLLQHCYQAEKFNPNHKEKYTPELKEGVLHREMGRNPENFGVNFLPVIYDISNIPEKKRNRYHIVKSLGEAEALSIKISSTLVSQGGFNCNGGGGGPIADPKKKGKFSIKPTCT